MPIDRISKPNRKKRRNIRASFEQSQQIAKNDMLKKANASTKGAAQAMAVQKQNSPSTFRERMTTYRQSENIIDLRDGHKTMRTLLFPNSH